MISLIPHFRLAFHFSEGASQVGGILTKTQIVENPHKVDLCLQEIDRETFTVSEIL